ncbi:type II toxin-antitoxin system PemK/MazF family toxin [Agreia sp. COWG]|uniref:type II toxin-antitoxin system PemK/MazF family toxin n=1 Tax=Agreia sp. COWG TaxID=2773266 RepID=UPI001AFC982B|nr:type II toxin-antitoxin system PemK/MazF family toxin [Agreia sp. COWG]CAD5998721.1 RNA 3'-terminal phosphate cyclase [Agreia sp. COWG]
MNLAGLLRSVLSALTPRTTVSDAKTTSGPGRQRPSTASVSPGQGGRDKTVEVPLSALVRARIRFAPRRDGSPDPGEVVWTWVPYEENDGRGKDRPVVIVARDGADAALGVYLTSKPHDADKQHFAYVGPGAWDSQGRPSWARLDRAFRVYDSGMRREAAALDSAQFDAIAKALKARL